MDGTVFWGNVALSGVSVEIREHVSDFQGPGATTLFGSGVTDASGYFRILGARTTSLRIEILNAPGYRTPVSIYYPSFCSGRINRAKPIYLAKLISGLSVPRTADGKVAAGTITATWSVMQGSEFYCVTLYDTTANAHRESGSCGHSATAERTNGTSYASPVLVAGHTYFLSVYALMGSTEIGFVSIQIDVQ